ncbi:MAG: hypothetical protein AAF749_14970, partial [Pseudomonadota bacterium]
MSEEHSRHADESKNGAEQSTAPLSEPTNSLGKYSSVFMLQVAHDLPAALTATMAPTLFVKQLGLDLSLIGVFFLPFIVTALKWTW